MRKSAMTPDALPHRGTAAPFRIGIGLALAASACVMLWGVSTHGVSASEFGPDAARETPMTLEDRVAALAAELAQVKAENAKLRESQSDTSGELSHIRASLANAEIGLAALRTTTDENEAHRRDTAAQVASNLRPAEGRDAPPPHGAGRHRNRDRPAARRRGEQRDRRRLAPRDHGRNPPADRAHRGCQGRDRLDRQEPQASGPQEVGGAALRRRYYPPLESGLEGKAGSRREPEVSATDRAKTSDPLHSAENNGQHGTIVSFWPAQRRPRLGRPRPQPPLRP